MNITRINRLSFNMFNGLSSRVCVFVFELFCCIHFVGTNSDYKSISVDVQWSTKQGKFCWSSMVYPGFFWDQRCNAKGPCPQNLAGHSCLTIDGSHGWIFCSDSEKPSVGFTVEPSFWSFWDRFDEV